MDNGRESRTTKIDDFQFVFSSRRICGRGGIPCSKQREHIHVPEEFYDPEVAVVHVKRKNLSPIVMRLNFPCSCSPCLRDSGVCVGNTDWRRIKDRLLEGKIIAFADAHLQEIRDQEKPRR